jgi:hypothetical protein
MVASAAAPRIAAQRIKELLIGRPQKSSANIDYLALSE